MRYDGASHAWRKATSPSRMLWLMMDTACYLEERHRTRLRCLTHGLTRHSTKSRQSWKGSTHGREGLGTTNKRCWGFRAIAHPRDTTSSSQDASLVQFADLQTSATDRTSPPSCFGSISRWSLTKPGEDWIRTRRGGESGGHLKHWQEADRCRLGACAVYWDLHAASLGRAGSGV